MPAKQLQFDDAARAKMVQGAEAVYRSVTTTLGPKGLNVTLERPYGRPQVVHDGVTVAREIELKDQFENMGAQLLIEASEKTNDKAGDGTTTAILLAYEILKAGMKEIANGENAQLFKDELKLAADKVIEYLKPMAQEVKTVEQMTKVAKLSAASEEIGKLVAEAYEAVGQDGVVAVDNATSPLTEVEIKDGVVIPAGYLIPHFITDPDTLKAELENAYVLVTDKDISAVDDILELLQAIHKKEKTIFIVAANVTGSALMTLAENKRVGHLKPLAIAAPRGGELRKGILDDIAVATGAVFISEGRDLSSVKLEELGKATKVISDRSETVIIGGAGKPAEIAARIGFLKKQVEKPESDFLRDNFQERLSRITGGVAVIYAGGMSDTEVREKRLRIEDASHATKGAMEEGIIPGGGVALYEARSVLAGKKTVGEKILYEALEQPLVKILRNSGTGEKEIWEIVSQLSKSPAGSAEVYDVVKKKFGNAFTLGVVDPLVVVRLALENAVSVASMILTTGAAVVEDKEKPLPPTA